ncbi:phage tail tip fiber protein [Aeromonas dhakensis]|uniref:phage tail tip fiber protein n=1 Tax=Aeromonas dhakensis TaxID=196024 RepID=UPI002B47D8D3|nr:phage tail protein [Aeromonas dhakensis]
MATAAFAVVSLVISAVSLAVSLSMKAPTQDQSDFGVAADRRGNDNPMLVPFGNCLVPMTQVYNNVNNSNTKYLAQLFSIGIGEIKSIQQLYINGVPYFGGNPQDQGTGWKAQGLSGNFPNVAVGLKRGLATESSAFTQIIQNSDGEVTASFRGDGIASVSVLAERWINTSGDNDIRFISPKNKWEALVQGNKVIDPRLDPNILGKTDKSKRVWGSSYYNPACVILTYLLDDYYGMGFEVEDIDITSFILLANYCDQQNIQFNGFINQDQTRGEMMKSFADSFGGDIYIESGVVKVRALDRTPATAHLSELNMLSEIKVLNKGAEEYANVIKVEYLNQKSNYSQDQYVIPKNGKTDPVIMKDGYTKEKTIKMPYLTDGGDLELVKFFANRAMKQAQLVKKSISFKIDNTLTKLKMNDVVEISNVMFSMDRKKFRIISIKSSMDDKMLISEIEATEYIEEIYNRGDYVSGGSSGSLPDPTLRIDPPSNLVFQQNTGIVQGNGVLSWTTNYKGEQRNEVQYKKSNSSTWVSYQTVTAERVTISNLQTGTDYDFRVRTQAPIGYSRFTELLGQRIAKVLSLPAVKNLTGDFTGRDAVIKWDAVKGPINNTDNPIAGFTDLSELVSYYQVQIAHNTIGNVKGTFVVSDPSFTYTLAQNRTDGSARSIYAIIKPVSIYGDVGSQASINLYNEAMSQPAAVEARSELVNLTIQWANLSDVVKDYEATDIWITSAKTQLPTSANYIASSTVGWWTSVLGGTAPKKGWVWIANRDVFGHPASGPVYSVPVYYEETSIDDLLTDSPSFQEVEQNLEQAKQELAEQGGEIVEIQNKVALQETAITDNKTLIETTNTKLAQTDSTVQAQGVKITEQTQALSTVDGKVNALKTIKLDVNGKVSGLQLGNDGTTSTVDFLTDVFRVSTGTNSQAVFEIRNGNTMIKNALIGNLTATQIQAGTITGNEISALSLIRVGSGATSASLSGQGDWRIYSGSTDPTQAPFRVHGNGTLVATNATIVGNITATSGTFTGAINAQSGSISGALWLANNAYISGNPAHHFLNGANGRFIVDQNGNLTCQYAVINGGTFHGTVKVEQLVGDVYRKDFYSQRVIPGRIISGGAGEQEFFRANIGAQAFSQRLVLSNVNAPVSMYDNPGTADFYYQIEGQSPIWYNKIDGPSNTRLPDLVNFTVHMPAGATWIRFFCVPNNKITWQRQSAIGGTIEVMKSQQVGISVTTN